MTSLHFDRDIAGVKTFWILQFKPETNEEKGDKREETPYYSVDFLIPSPFGSDEWLVLNTSANKQTLASLQQFQKLCEETKARCKKEMQGISSTPGDKMKKATKELENLTNIVRYFNKLMKRIKNEEPPTDSSNEPKES
jgi:hypothetical protein